jgi:chromosome segregation ATPase
MEKVKDECDKLIASETMDKNHALGMMRIQHAMENLLLVLEHEKLTQINDLNYEIKMLQNEKAKNDKIKQLEDDIALQKNLHGCLSDTMSKVDCVVEKLYKQTEKNNAELQKLIQDFQFLQDDFLQTKTEFKTLLAHVSSMPQKKK